MVSTNSLPNRLHGKIVADSTGVGIPDLLVVAMDFDALRWAQTAPSQQPPPATHVPNPRPKPEAPIESVHDALALLEQAPFNEAAQPQRLGSVLTRADGSFELVYHDDLFRDDDASANQQVADRRPDVILLVLAPDRPGKNGEGRTLRERLIFHTQPIRFEAGRTESYIIRIGEERLAAFNVPLSGSDGTVVLADPEQYRAARALSYKNAAELSSVKQELYRTYELPRVTKEQRTFSKVLPNLVQGRIGAMANFVGFAPSYDVLSRRVWENLRLIPWLQPGQPQSVPRTGRVYLNERDLRQLGLSRAAIESGAGQEIEFARLLNHIGYAAGPYRNRDLLSQIEGRRALARLAAAPSEDHGADEPADTPPSSVSVDSVRDNVLKRLEEQLDGLARSGGEADPAHDLSRIKQTIEKLEQNSGVANVAAMHDVELLQVAFEPAWTAAFDDDLKQQAKDLYREVANEEVQAACGSALRPLEDVQNVQQLREMLSDIVSASRGSASPQLRRVGQLALDLSRRLAEPYSFKYFAPGSINYGILLTYRQSWTPLSYQVGRLAETVPLAPGETRTLKITRTVRRTAKRSSREKSNLQRLSESSSISRTEIEAMEKTALAMSNQTGAQAQFNIGIGSIGGTTQFNVNQSREAQSIHKSFAEIARKASQEVRREVEVQFDEETVEEAVSETTRTFRNTNDELTVTYLLYELERRYRVSSHIQAVQPVILVALDMPAPIEINDAWLLEHAWVIRSVLLDPAFEEALDLLEDNRSQDQAELALLKANYDAARAVHSRAELEFERLSQQARSRRESIVSLMQGEDIAKAGEASDEQRVAAAIFSGGLTELFGGGQSNTDDILRAKREAVEKSLEYLEAELAAAADARDQAIAVLNSATEKYSAALAAKAMADQKLLQLRLHVRANIFHYMHAIWRHRDHDDLFFSLYDLEVPFLEPMSGQCRLRKPTDDELDQEVPGVVIDGELYMVDIHPATAVPDYDDLPKRRLIEIADVDRPLGFKGNYVIFPLKKSSLLTDYMTVGYLDGYFGVRDPALDASYSASDLLEYAKSVWNDPVVGLTDEQRSQLASLILRAGMRNPGYESEIVLPTGQIFMEALKGDQALLEDFKLAHRGMDVLKAEEEVRQARIDSLRRAQRIGLAEPQLEDPDIERMTLISGARPGVVIDADQ